MYELNLWLKFFYVKNMHVNVIEKIVIIVLVRFVYSLYKLQI